MVGLGGGRIFVSEDFENLVEGLVSGAVVVKICSLDLPRQVWDCQERVLYGLDDGVTVEFEVVVSGGELEEIVVHCLQIHELVGVDGARLDFGVGHEAGDAFVRV